MKNVNPETDPDKGKDTPRAGSVNISCDEIRKNIFPYFTHELGGSRAELVRHHLRHCADCRKEAGDIENAIKKLKMIEQPSPPTQLDKAHKRNIRLLVWHPVWNWILIHHRLISLLAALIALILFFVWLINENPQIFPFSNIHTVTIGNPDNPLPENK